MSKCEFLPPTIVTNDNPANPERRNAINKIVLSTAVACAFPSIALGLEENENEISDQELIKQFAELINSTKDTPPQINDTINLGAFDQSFFNNLNHILPLLYKNPELIDKTSYHLFERLRKNLQQRPRTEALTQEEYRIIRELRHHIAEHGYYFNYNSQVDRTNPFMKGEFKTLAIKSFPALKKTFPRDLLKDESMVKFFYTEELSESEVAHLGRAAHELVVISLTEIKNHFKRISKCVPQNNFWKGLHISEFIKNTENNELGHLTLASQYGLTPGDNLDWSNAESGLLDFKIKSSQEVHEFVSDTMSLNAGRASLISLIRTTLFSDFQAELNPQSALINKRYSYSLTFLMPHLGTIFQEEMAQSIQNLVKNASEGIDDENFSKSFTQEVKNLLSLLTQDDLTKLQESYTNQTQILLTETKRLKALSPQT